MTTPYSQLPPRNFWKLAVPGRAPGEFEDLWRPKFALSPNDRFATAGSCFAQRISGSLLAANYHWVDSEPAPKWLSDEQARQYGYGVFSFRTGNIYTGSLLRQWVEMALGLQSPPAEVWETDGRFYDPLRPAIEPGGYASAAECLHARDYTLRCMRESLAQLDVLIFTLGLTEAWRNAETGLWYPMCPGTLAGTFDGAVHKLHKLSYNETLEDVSQAFARIRSVNPKARFVLAVSPVPLTATASEDHALVAATYSKSVLRAVAGTLADADPGVDYFPSYEVVATPPARGAFYDSNMRTVTADGIARVMQYFFDGLQGAAPAPPSRQITAEPAAEPDDNDDVCEDELLEAFAPENAAAKGSAA